MAWENVIIGYQIVKAWLGDEIPADWVYLTTTGTNRHGQDMYIFKKPIYKKKNIKRQTK